MSLLKLSIIEGEGTHAPCGLPIAEETCGGLRATVGRGYGRVGQKRAADQGKGTAEAARAASLRRDKHFRR
jgi:hypothetical protein